MITPTGPFLRMAALCEQVVEAKDGRISVINVIDQVTNTATGPEVPDEMPEFQIQMKAVVALKAGQARGRFGVRIQPQEPSGALLPSAEIPIQFGGQEDAGANLIVDLVLNLKYEGVYWIAVQLVPAPGIEPQLLSRIPLRVLYQPQKTVHS